MSDPLPQLQGIQFTHTIQTTWCTENIVRRGKHFDRAYLGRLDAESLLPRACGKGEAPMGYVLEKDVSLMRGEAAKRTETAFVHFANPATLMYGDAK